MYLPQLLYLDCLSSTPRISYMSFNFSAVFVDKKNEEVGILITNELLQPRPSGLSGGVKTISSN
ncbi:hypothetical protein ACTXT7_000736 [Hymenolepis weldensis]